MKRTGPTNTEAQQLIAALKQIALSENAPIWTRIADDLEKPSRQRRIVNIYKLEKFAKDGDVIIVPGKVLGMGEIHQKVKVAAFTFSQQAVDKIHGAGGQTLGISELVQKNPKGKNVRIFG